ncbi:MAG: dihydrofolate reductase [Planctomycetes bacterium]|nr:dihydrofolate reductase [Planctomycetota bacterium]
MANYVYIATSLDGFIATKDGGVDWLMEVPNPEKSDYGFFEFMNSVDAIVMGRNTFEKVLSFYEWPYNKIVFVLSNSLTDIPEKLKGKVEIIKGELEAVINELKTRGYNNLYIDGGKVIQSFLNEDLIDDMIITRVPILLGDGIPLFDNLKQNLKFRHIKTEIFNNTLVKSCYTRARENE